MFNRCRGVFDDAYDAETQGDPTTINSVHDEYSAQVDAMLRALKRAVRIEDDKCTHECFRSVVFLLKVFVLPLEMAYAPIFKKRLTMRTVSQLLTIMPDTFEDDVLALKSQCETGSIEFLDPFVEAEAEEEEEEEEEEVEEEDEEEEEEEEEEVSSSGM